MRFEELPPSASFTGSSESGLMSLTGLGPFVFETMERGASSLMMMGSSGGGGAASHLRALSPFLSTGFATIGAVLYLCMRLTMNARSREMLKSQKVE
jgi:hypothetical protein